MKTSYKLVSNKTAIQYVKQYKLKCNYNLANAKAWKKVFTWHKNDARVGFI